MTDDTTPVDARYAFVESMSGDEALMFATYLASISPEAFTRAAELVERDRVALGGGLPEDVPAVPEPPTAPAPEVPETVPAPTDVPAEPEPPTAPGAPETVPLPGGVPVPRAPVDVPEPEPVAEAAPEPPAEVSEPVPLPVPPALEDVPATTPEPLPVLVAVPPNLPEPREVYLLAVREFVAPGGGLRRRPSIRALKRVLGCGQERAQDVRAYLRELAAS
ncbi:hypothetical protein ACFYOK_29315 [Microbispora bryophytorum]|uniref:hypothetical protein n=1 Tax=Microbispora bryophytorum TaxID=1460882 RepID=UPI0033D6E450